MKLIIGGCRGTSPVSRSDFVKYGGETTSLLFEGRGGERIMIDAGTGARTLGHRLQTAAGRQSLLLLMTHYHLDHVMGLPSLPIIYSPYWTIDMAAPRHERYGVADVMPRVMHRPFWPLQIENLDARIRFRTLRSARSVRPLVWGALEVRWCAVHHPGGCTAYRIDEPATGASCVVATDLEWARATPRERNDLMELCATPAPARVLYMDGNFQPREYPRYKGWGHSTWDECVQLARHVGVARLLVGHHSPDRNDRELAAVEREVRAAMRRAALARGGMEIEIGGRP